MFYGCPAAHLMAPCETRSLHVPGRCLWHPRWHLSGPPGAPIRARTRRGGTMKNREFNDIMVDLMAQKLDLWFNHDLTMEKMEISWDIHGDLMDK